jgi:hypothetical protein
MPRILFTHPRAREVFPDWQSITSATVYALHLNAARFSGAPEIGDLVQRRSEVFQDQQRPSSRIWRRPRVRDGTCDRGEDGPGCQSRPRPSSTRARRQGYGGLVDMGGAGSRETKRATRATRSKGRDTRRIKDSAWTRDGILRAASRRFTETGR